MYQGNAQQALNRYRSVQVTTCTPSELLVLLFDGLIRFLGEAEQFMKADDRGRAGEKISRSHAILEMLLNGLDKSHAPELCANLEGVYTFCMHRIVKANVARDPAMIAEVIRVLVPLQEAWRIAAAKVAEQQKAGGGPSSG